jgi:hypothetical protein
MDGVIEATEPARWPLLYGLLFVAGVSLLVWAVAAAVFHFI